MSRDAHRFGDISKATLSRISELSKKKIVDGGGLTSEETEELEGLREQVHMTHPFIDNTDRGTLLNDLESEQKQLREILNQIHLKKEAKDA